MSPQISIRVTQIFTFRDRIFDTLLADGMPKSKLHPLPPAKPLFSPKWCEKFTLTSSNTTYHLLRT